MAKGKAIDTLSGEDREWRAQRDLETLIEAEKIKADKDRLKAAMAKKREMQANLKKVA